MISNSLLRPLIVVVVAAAAAHSDGIVTGVPVSPRASSVPLRRSISELHGSGGAQWDLYIRALISMQQTDPSDPLSYFQVMGIHGKPYVEWNDGGEERPGDWQGYCPHGEKLFLSWHRPFVVLYEQILVDHAKRIALEYPRRYRHKYIKAAEELRSPFWDWGLEGIPAAVIPQKLMINVPEGGLIVEMEVDNPLATYTFPSERIDDSFDVENRTRIFRCPAPDDFPSSANQRLSERPYKRWIYDCFMFAKSFADFASTDSSGISLEQIHNGVHWDGACGGQFLASDYTAFDPLFMLHHTNVDRLWAYWQVISPAEAIFGDSYIGGSRFSTLQGTKISADSPLQPFFRSKGRFHTTHTVRRIQDFGYSYQELEHWRKSTAEMGHDARKLINRLYGPDNSEGSQVVPLDADRNITRYLVSLEVDVAEIERPSVVQIHFQDVKAGEIVLMEHPMTGIVHGSFSIDEAIEASNTLGYNPDETLKLIEPSLTAHITRWDDSRVPLSSVKGLKVSIEAVPVMYHEGNGELPSLGPLIRWPIVVSEFRTM